MNLVKLHHQTTFSTLRLGLIVFFIISLLASALPPLSVSAADATKFKAGNIISDSIFTNDGSMSVSKIQSFLNSKVPTCDTNGSQNSEMNNAGVPDYNGNGTIQRWEWGKKKYNQTKFYCLKDYSQGGKSAAQIIYDKAKKYSINPQVLIVLLQKEQALVTDTWPLTTQYTYATGYCVPDNGPPPCDDDAYGFTNQVDYSAKMFRAIMNDSPTWYTPYELGNNEIKWHPDDSCGTSTVNIQNRATQALYNYTPYRPNQAALNAGYGMGNSCSSYGNRNFFLYFTDWFGSTTASYDASVISTTVYSDSARNVVLDPSTTTVSPGQTVYVRIVGKNTGSKQWDRSFVRVATIEERNRTDSKFANDRWLSTSRPAKMKEATMNPTENGTFEFSLTMPNDVGMFSESFGLVADGKAWMDSEKINLSFTVAPSVDYDAKIISTKTYLDSGLNQEVNLNKRGIRPEGVVYVQLKAKNIGKKPWDNSFTRLATVNPRNHTDSPFIADDWYSTSRPATMLESSIATGQTGTFNFTLQAPSEEDNFSDSFGLVADGKAWMDSDIYNARMNVYGLGSTLSSNMRMYPGDTISNGYRLVMQGDGNLVIYNRNNKAVWSSGTAGKNADNLVMQGDGNLVLYNTSGKAIWTSGNKAAAPSRVVMQGDGNLVIYNRNNKAVWSSGTAGK